MTVDMICRECGHIFDEGEAKFFRERHMEVDGTPDSEYFRLCPCCGSGEIEFAAYCEKCGGSFLEDSLIAGYYCKECAAEFLETRYAAGFAVENLYEFCEYVHEKEECECQTKK